MSEIFVAHEPADRTAAQAIIEALAKEGLRVSDPKSPAHNAACVVVLWSTAASRSAIRQIIPFWSEGRLVLANLDQAELPIGLRDLQVPLRRTANALDTTDLIRRVKAIINPVLFDAIQSSRQERDIQALQAELRPQVFVSYSRLDLPSVEHLIKHIEQAGYAVWIDRQEASLQRYAARIVQAIKGSQFVALMCSRNAFQSDHVIREIYVAGDHRKPFVVFQLDQSDFPDDVIYFVSGFPRVKVQTLDPDGLRSEISRLLRSRQEGARDLYL